MEDLVFPPHGPKQLPRLVFDDTELELIALAHQRRMRTLQWSVGGPIVFSIAIVLALWLSAKPAHAEADNYACYGSARYEAMSSAKPGCNELPFYCRALAQLPRNCASVKRTARTFGAARAERMARKCGASDVEIAEAKACK